MKKIAIAILFFILSLSFPYGHPDEEVLSRLADADVIIMRTDQLGTIVCYSNGAELTFSTESTR